MTHFSDTSDWTLTNDFTIEHADRLKDRPMMTTRVPHGIDLELHDIRIIHSIRWQSKEGLYVKPSESKEGAIYKLVSGIRARATMKDSITVFTVPGGAMETYRTIADVSILPLPRGQVGGKQRATSFDGIAYSGMSSRKVPDGGLMDGEPGSLMYVDSTDNGFEKDFPKQKYLSLSLYVDEQEWGLMVQRLSQTAAPVHCAFLHADIELFQSEVENSLAEPWHRKDYGLLQRDPKSDFCTTAARADHLRVEYKPVSVPPPPTARIDEDGIYQKPIPYEPVSAITVQKIEKRLKEIGITVAIGLVAIFVVLVSR